MKVLIVEDDQVIADGMARHLRASGLDPVWVPRGLTGLSRLRYERPDVCVLDLMLPELDGWELIETARREGSARRSSSSARAAARRTACARSSSARTTTW